MAAVDRIAPFLELIRAEATAALTHRIERSIVIPGVASVWDGCEQLSVRLIQVKPKATDPRIRRPNGGCGIQTWTLRIGLETVRCVSTIDDDRKIPSPRQLAADSAALTQDFCDLENFLLCTDKFVIEDILEWNPKGPDGGFAAGDWQFTVAMGVCPCG